MDFSTMSGDEIVITGISGKFPNSANVKVFQKNILTKVDCVTDDEPRWILGNPKIPERIGKMSGISKFDPLAFGIHPKFADHMDPMQRMLIECAYEAVTDAGINPREMRGKNTMVLTGTSISESEKTFFNLGDFSGFPLLGAAKAMFANRISFSLGLQGPSINVDASSIGSAVCLQRAYRSIKNGEVDSAIVGGANVVLHPEISLSLFNLGLLSPDGVTRSFDDAANGYTRSESVVVLFLQRARDAKRIYSELKNIQSMNGPASDRLSVLYPTSEFQMKVMRQTLDECGISGKDVSFIEADGLGIKHADAEEVEAIDKVFNEGRKTPLLIGSVKSNVGSCSAADTLISIVKLITMMETGYIPPNLHYETPSEQIPALKEGRIGVVTKTTPWTGDYAAINTTSIGGSCCSVILKSYKKEKVNCGEPDDDLSRLVTVSGYNEEAVAAVLDDVESRPVDVEMLQLLNDVFRVENLNHLYRGYTVLPPRGIVNTQLREIQYSPGEKKEIWYIFSGMGSQWVGMGEAFMKLPVFAEAVRKCDVVLKPHGIDIIRILTEKDPTMFDNIINSFVGIAVVQIGLVDLLTYLGIKPDFMIGHSVGELGCAYADGCFTAEQMVLSALSRGLASVESNLSKGSMAAVGLGYEDIKPLCPADIDVACHNSPQSSTISGPADSIAEFVASLQAKKIFAKGVATGNIAFHSRYIAPAGQKLRDYLQKVIPTPKPRTKSWHSTSVPKNEWGTARARLSSAEYHTNNLLNPVLFSEISKMIPPNAIAIEIAPFGLLQAILKKSLPKTAVNIHLAKREHTDNIEVLMAAFGKLYNAGYKVDPSKLYPRVNYPVSRGTPSVSSLMRWDHSRNWIAQFYKKPKAFKPGEVTYKIDLSSETWNFLKGNRIGDKIFLPCSLYLKLAWSVVYESCDKVEVPMVFEQVVIHKTQYINEEDEVFELVIMVQKGSGTFEVTYNRTLLCSGVLRKMDLIGIENIKIDDKIDEDTEELTSIDVYSELQMRGFEYSNSFRSIHKSSANGSNGYLFCKEEWLTFLDGMFQIFILGNNIRTAQVPLKIRKIIIDYTQFRKNCQYSRAIPVLIDRQLGVVCSGGFEIQGIQLMYLKRKASQSLVNIEEVKFVANSDETTSSKTELASIVLQLLIENTVSGNSIRLIKNEANNIDRILKKWEQILKEIPEAKFTVDVVSPSCLEKNDLKYSRAALLVFPDAETFKKTNLLKVVKEGDFLLSFYDSQDENDVLNFVDSLDFAIVLKKRLSQKQLATLFRKKRVSKNTCVLEIIDEDIFLDNKIRAKISQGYERVILSNRIEDSTKQIEILELFAVNPSRKKIKFFDILDSEAPKISLENPFYQSQLHLDLNFNVLTSDRKWGTRRRFPIAQKRREVKNWKASQIRPGDLNSIDWVKEQFCDNTDNTKIVKVEYSTINETDLILATGEVTSYLTNERYGTEKVKLEMKSFGLEYSGIDIKGTNVMGLSRSGTLASFTIRDSEFTWEVPKGWSLDEAVTVPLAYVASYKALYLNGDLQKKESILIYDGACPFGQATLNLALSEDCDIFTTYSTKEEKEFLKIRYPSINEDHIFSLKDAFVDLMLLATKGQGVDLMIYNSSNLKKIESCLMGLKNNARVIVLGNLEGAFNKSIGLSVFLKEVYFSSVISKNLVYGEMNSKKNIASMVEDGLRRGVVKPLSSTVYSRDELRNAFLDGSQQIGYGKIVVKVQPENLSSGTLVIPRFSYSNTGSYLIIDNLSNFGIQLTDFLIDHGAKDILIASDMKNSKSLFYYHNKKWQKLGAQVILREDLDFSAQKHANTLLKEASKINKIHAIFDLQRMEETSHRTSSSKYLFTKFLNEESRKICAGLRQFVVFSISKNADENLNNLLLKEINVVKLCEERSKSGLPVLLILWGPMKGTNQTKFVAENEISLLSIPECMEKLIGLDSTIVIVSRNEYITNRNLQRKFKTKIVEEKSEEELFTEYLHTSAVSSGSKLI